MAFGGAAVEGIDSSSGHDGVPRRTRANRDTGRPAEGNARSSDKESATVHVERDAADEAGFVAGEKSHRRRHVGRRAQAAHGNAGQGGGWTAPSNAPWLTTNGSPSGAGDGNVTFTAAPNTTPVARTGTITIGNKLYTVTQGAATCDFAIEPASASIASGYFNAPINVTAMCSWPGVHSAS